MLRLGRLDQARADLTQAIALCEPIGFAAEPWRNQANLANLETAAHNPTAAATAHAEAIRLSAAYRDGGGAPQQWTGCLVQALHAALAQGADPADLAAQLPPLDQFPPDLHPFRHALESLLRHEPADPDDPRHYYDQVVELRRLAAALASRR